MTQPHDHLAQAKAALQEAYAYIDQGLFINRPEGYLLHAIAHALTGILQLLAEDHIKVTAIVEELPRI